MLVAFFWVGGVVANNLQRRNFSMGESGATLLGDHTAVEQHMPGVALGPHMQLRVVPRVSRYVLLLG